MISLQAGSYLGEVVQIKRANGLIASVTKYPNVSYSENLHCHDTLHMSLVLNGGNLERRKHKDILREPGVVTFYDAGELHQSTHTAPGSRHVNLEIEEKFLVAHGLPLNAEMFTKGDRVYPLLMMQRIFAELNVDDNDTSLAIESAVLAMFQTTNIEYRNARPAWVNVVKQFITDHWNQPIGLNELAAAAGVHPVTISKHFPQHFGCTVSEYRRRVKINHALQMMRSTSAPLTAVAIDCGFSDQSHFNRVFKQIVGASPLVYKSF